MTSVLLIIHLFVTLALIGVVLIQRSEGGGLGIGSSQGMGSFMGGRGTANLLTRTTAVLATAFMALSLALALLNRGTAGVGRSILDTAPTTSIPAPAGQPAPTTLPPPHTPPPVTTSQPLPVQPSPQPAAPAAAPPTGPQVPTH